jgi:hypothetical protein
MNRFSLIAVFLTALITLAGCAGYHCGSVAHPEMRTAEILPTNLTEEPMVAQQLRMKFQQRLFQDSGLRLAPRGTADMIVKAKIISISQAAAGATRIDRSNDPRADRYSSDYRTSLYQATVTIEYEVWKRGKTDAPFLPAHKVAMSANFPRLPDLQTARQVAVENAIDAAVSAMLAEITESW